MALPKFCEKCETMHSAGRPCDARGLKAVSSCKTAHGEIENASDLKSAASGLEGASPSGPTITETTQAIKNIIADEARSSTVEPSAHNALVASSSLAAPTIPASSKGRIPFFENGDLGSSPGAGASSELPRQQPFDRIAYQRDYMRDRPLALAEGLTVKVWRTKHGKE